MTNFEFDKFQFWHVLNFDKFWILSLGSFGALLKPPRPKGDADRAPSLHHFRPWHLPYIWGKITEKPQSGHPKGARLLSAQLDSFDRLGHRQAMSSTGLLAPASLGLRVWRRGQPSVSVGLCRVAVLGGSPRQVTLSRNSRSELWRGRRRMEHPDPRESTCYLGTKGWSANYFI
jgi:hypothetical protein